MSGNLCLSCKHVSYLNNSTICFKKEVCGARPEKVEKDVCPYYEECIPEVY